MPYDYKTEKQSLFTEDNQVMFLEIRDKVHNLLSKSGAVTMEKILMGVSGNAWLQMACIDRLIELHEIREIKSAGYVAGQYRIFVPFDKNTC